MQGKVLFDVQHLYYLPQYLPVARALMQEGILCEFILHKEHGLDVLKQTVLEKEGFRFQFIEGKSDTYSFYCKSDADWIIFGNRPYFKAEQKKDIKARFALMLHGIGPKACYYDVSRFPFDVRFVEGENRLTRLQKMYPDRRFIDSGYAKLDPIFGATEPLIDIAALGLDSTKPTVLYAPTFFPSSIECFPSNWPETLSNVNIIVKPHFFSLTKSKYSSQKQKVEAWSHYDNVYLANVKDFDLLPFMQVSDIMLSDASSAIFEFAAIDRPIVWCDFFRTRWNYSGFFNFRLKKRLDPDIALFNEISHRAGNPFQANMLIAECLKQPMELSAERKRITQNMVGVTDGKCSERIAEYLTTQ
ncbi:CDP-glycerol glycerophosphotransferase family protein [Alteromonas sp. 1_MG-2023]|uniref:CDP-glycerol glycerophosphotransferase family protein n=1 Tax=Alteromonas sp. 1_MG-2023 TaxID=3062669 RepID=UPI0026E43834|nr:CDP-glycerol glycerophosphotransferase family protein [Alteromonas sp. 1_MG-2023]MDO6566466.1 CDP-glycerol glycerophosphotransferase family protein [Alteromonas sp. 1_MG-2023]